MKASMVLYDEDAGLIVGGVEQEHCQTWFDEDYAEVCVHVTYWEGEFQIWLEQGAIPSAGVYGELSRAYVPTKITDIGDAEDAACEVLEFLLAIPR